MDGLVLAVLWLHEAGKAGTHAVRAVTTSSAARRPLIPGLAISDAYHAMSGAQWLAPLGLAWAVWGLPVVLDGWVPEAGPRARWWAAYVLGSGVIWPVSKRWKGLTWREAIGETFWMQILTWPWRRHG